MMAAVRRLVGADRAAPAFEVPPLDRERLDKPVAAAQAKADQAQQAHQLAREALERADRLIAEAQERFDAEASDGTESALLDAKRARERLELHAGRAQRLAASASAALAAAENARREAFRADSLERIRQVPARVQALWAAQGAPALQALARFNAELDKLLDDARVAAMEATQGDTDQRHAETMGINGLRNVVRSLASESVTPAELVQIERLVGR